MAKVGKIEPPLNFSKLMCLSHAADFPFRQNKINRWKGCSSRHPNEFHFLPHMHNVSWVFRFRPHPFPSVFHFKVPFWRGEKKFWRIIDDSPRKTKRWLWSWFHFSRQSCMKSTIYGPFSQKNTASDDLCAAAFKDAIQREQKDAGLQGWNSK